VQEVEAIAAEAQERSARKWDAIATLSGYVGLTWAEAMLNTENRKGCKDE